MKPLLFGLLPVLIPQELDLSNYCGANQEANCRNSSQYGLCRLKRCTEQEGKNETMHLY